MNAKQKKILLIAGFDPTGHAGILRDAETCLRLDAPYHSFVTALTAQNDAKFFSTHVADKKFLASAWQCCDVQNTHAVKIGMLGTEVVVKFLLTQLSALKKINPNVKIVWDPVFTASSNGKLLNDAGIKLALKKLLPMVDVITPNAIEACHILGAPFAEKLQGEDLILKLAEMWPKHVAIYLKGGHLKKRSVDWLVTPNARYVFAGARWQTKLRGTDCLFSTALAVALNQGSAVDVACENAKEFVSEMLREEIKKH